MTSPTPHCLSRPVRWSLIDLDYEIHAFIDTSDYDFEPPSFVSDPHLSSGLRIRLTELLVLWRSTSSDLVDLLQLDSWLESKWEVLPDLIPRGSHVNATITK